MKLEIMHNAGTANKQSSIQSVYDFLQVYFVYHTFRNTVHTQFMAAGANFSLKIPSLHLVHSVQEKDAGLKTASTERSHSDNEIA